MEYYQITREEYERDKVKRLLPPQYEVGLAVKIRLLDITKDPPPAFELYGVIMGLERGSRGFLVLTLLHTDKTQAVCVVSDNGFIVGLHRHKEPLSGYLLHPIDWQTIEPNLAIALDLERELVLA